MPGRDPYQQGQSIVQALGGQWRGEGGLCRCPAHADRNPSLSVRVGDTSLLFHCFAGCDNREVLAALRRGRLLDSGLVTVDYPIVARAPRYSTDPQFLLNLWSRCLPVRGTLADRYLAARAIGNRTPELRFAPAARIGRGATAYTGPALVAAVRDDHGLCALQRTFLSGNGRSKASIEQPRRMIGNPGRGAARLSTPTRILGLAEGLETALSASELLQIPVWASLGNRRLPEIALPSDLEELVILADHDAPGRRAGEAAMATYARPGLAVRCEWPPAGMNDWNDLARASRGEGAGRV